MKNLPYVLWVLGWPALFLFNSESLLPIFKSFSAEGNLILFAIWLIIWIQVGADLEKGTENKKAEENSAEIEEKS